MEEIPDKQDLDMSAHAQLMEIAGKVDSIELSVMAFQAVATQAMQVAEEAAALDLDDLFERETPQASGSGGRWSGYIQYPQGTFLATSPAEVDPADWRDTIDGKYFKLKYSDGTFEFVDAIEDDPADYDDYAYVYVADSFEDDEDPPNVSYLLSPRQCGDIIIPFRPYRCVS